MAYFFAWVFSFVAAWGFTLALSPNSYDGPKWDWPMGLLASGDVVRMISAYKALDDIKL